MIVIQILAWSIPIADVHLDNFFTSPPFNVHPMWASIVANVVRFVVAVIVDQGRIADISTIIRSVRVVIVEVVAPKINPQNEPPLVVRNLIIPSCARSRAEGRPTVKIVGLSPTHPSRPPFAIGNPHWAII